MVSLVVDRCVSNVEAGKKPESREDSRPSRTGNVGSQAVAPSECSVLVEALGIGKVASWICSPRKDSPPRRANKKLTENLEGE